MALWTVAFVTLDGTLEHFCHFGWHFGAFFVTLDSTLEHFCHFGFLSFFLVSHYKDFLGGCCKSDGFVV